MVLIFPPDTYEKLTRPEINHLLEQNSHGSNWHPSPSQVNFWFTPTNAIAYYQPGLRQFTILTKNWAAYASEVTAQEPKPFWPFPAPDASAK